MKTLFCNHCHKEVGFLIEKKSNNNVAFCSDCGCYIKNVPNSFLGIEKTYHVFYFGKFKGIKVKDCTDKNYLLWAMNNLTNVSDSFLDAIFERLEELSNT